VDGFMGATLWQEERKKVSDGSKGRENRRGNLPITSHFWK